MFSRALVLALMSAVLVIGCEKPDEDKTPPAPPATPPPTPTAVVTAAPAA